MNNRESNRKGGRGGREEKEGRELLFDRKSTNRQRQGRQKGAEVRERNARTNVSTHTLGITKRLAGGS